MATTRNRKKNLIVSYKNLADDIKDLFKETYPDGYSNHLQKFVKPNGEPIFVVPLETDDTAYMIKFEVKIDTLGDGDDLDKDIYDGEGDKDDEFAPISEALEKEDDNNSHTERHLRHGDFEDTFGDEKKKAISLDLDKDELKAAFADDDDIDSYDDDFDDNEPDDDEFEPSADDIRSIEDEFLDAENPPLDATIPDEEKAAPRSSKTSKTTASKTKTSKSTTSKSTAKATTKSKSTKKKA